MRRQVKPFVTEYRASSRRGKDASPPSGRSERENARESDASRELFATPFNAAPSNPGSDDSYEAALKAADALFSNQRPPSQPSEASDPAAIRPVAKPTRPLTAAEAVFAQPAAAPERAVEAPESNGRILRAIEEPQADPYAALEAERAPKRRGRKPGSKNKPKVLPGLVSSAATTALARPAALPPRAYQASIETPFASYVALTSDSESYAAPVSLALRKQASTPRNSKSKGPFAWVRVKLGPGEKWKRRLPKVIW